MERAVNGELREVYKVVYRCSRDYVKVIKERREKKRASRVLLFRAEQEGKCAVKMYSAGCAAFSVWEGRER